MSGRDGNADALAAVGEFASAIEADDYMSAAQAIARLVESGSTDVAAQLIRHLVASATTSRPGVHVYQRMDVVPPGATVVGLRIDGSL